LTRQSASYIEFYVDVESSWCEREDSDEKEVGQKKSEKKR